MPAPEVHAFPVVDGPNSQFAARGTVVSGDSYIQEQWSEVTPDPPYAPVNVEFRHSPAAGPRVWTSSGAAALGSGTNSNFEALAPGDYVVQMRYLDVDENPISPWSDDIDVTVPVP